MGCSSARTVYIWPTIRTPSTVSRTVVGAAGAQPGGCWGVLLLAVCLGLVVGWDMGTPEEASGSGPVCVRHDRPMAPPGAVGAPGLDGVGRGTVQGEAQAVGVFS